MYIPEKYQLWRGSDARMAQGNCSHRYASRCTWMRWGWDGIDTSGGRGGRGGNGEFSSIVEEEVKQRFKAFREDCLVVMPRQPKKMGDVLFAVSEISGKAAAKQERSR